MFATVNRDEDTAPAPYPDPLPRPDGRPARTGPEAEAAAGTPRPAASPTEILAFLSSP
ncbi:hypothetical protein QFZ75_005175 [Streptomyces sp. V3I8]|jgi:hypothetical protein|nr:hypothetical protein [Streptomyces sp. V3I8]